MRFQNHFVEGIFLEGPDCCGKSTIMDFLCNFLEADQIQENSIKYVNCPYGGDVGSMMYGEYHTLLRMIECGFLGNFIKCRSYYSEKIYSKVLNRKSLMDLAWMVDVEERFKKNNLMHIFLLPKWETIEAIYKKRGDDYIDKVDNLKKIYLEYIIEAQQCSTLKMIIKDCDLMRTKEILMENLR